MVEGNEGEGVGAVEAGGLNGVKVLLLFEANPTCEEGKVPVDKMTFPKARDHDKCHEL